MNVASEGEVWLSYHADFPLVRLRAFTFEHLWPSFHPMVNAFAVRGEEVLYLDGEQLMISELELLQEQQSVMAVDEQGISLSLGKDARPEVAARSSSFLIKTEAALYELIR